MSKAELTAVFCALTGACLWGIVWWPIKTLEQLGVTGLWTTFLVFSLIGTTTLPALVSAHLRGRCPLSAGPALVLLVFGGLTNFLFFLALGHTSVVRALMLFYLSPIWNLIAARIVRGHPLTARKALVVFVSLSGAFTVLGLHRTGIFTWGLGDTLALASGLCFAVSVVGIQKSPATPGWALAVINWLGSALFALAAIALLAPPPPPANLRDWLPLLLVLAFLVQGTASFCILFSLTRLESYRVNVLMLFEIVAGTLSFALWSAQAVRGYEWTGIGLIVAASLIDNHRALRTAGRRHRKI